MKTLIHISVFILFAAVLAISNHAFASGVFHLPNGARPPTQVNSRIWRSGRPTRSTLTFLYQQGVRSIIDLEDDDDAVRAEITMAKLMGFTVYSFPTDSLSGPEEASMNRILNILRTAPAPVLVHCLHGEDRTGLVIGLERVKLEQWSPDRAYEEMLNKGFHELLLGLTNFFAEQTAH